MRNKPGLLAGLVLIGTTAMGQVATLDPAASLPAGAKAAISAKFPGAAVEWAQTGELHQAGVSDIAVLLSGMEESRGRLIAVLWPQADGRYRVADASPWLDPGGGNYDFEVALEKRSLFIHTSYPGTDVAESDNYQFGYRSGVLRLIGYRMELFGHGERNGAYHYISEVNFMTGAKRDVLEDEVQGGKMKRRVLQTRVPVRAPMALEAFQFWEALTQAESCKRIASNFELVDCGP